MDKYSGSGPMAPGNPGAGFGRVVVGFGTAATLGSGAALLTGGPPVFGGSLLAGGVVVAGLGAALIRWGNRRERAGFVPFTVEDDSTTPGTYPAAV